VTRSLPAHLPRPGRIPIRRLGVPDREALMLGASVVAFWTSRARWMSTARDATQQVATWLRAL